MGKAYRRRGAAARHGQWVKGAALFGGVVLAVFTAGMIETRGGSLPVTAQAGVGAAGAGTCHFLNVHDGDTIRCGTERIRIENIDAPELAGSPKCEDYRAAYAWCDFEQGRMSRDALRSFLDGGPVEVSRHGKDKYGRTLARITVNGKDAGDYLVARALRNHGTE